MLIIGHRGSKGTHPENSLQALREVIDSGADMAEFDVRLTKDGQVVLGHDFTLARTHRSLNIVSRSTLAELRAQTAGSSNPVITLHEAVACGWKQTLLNIEIKQSAAVDPTLDTLRDYITSPEDWEYVIFSSFNPLTLRTIRARAPHAQLALLHYFDPMTYMLWHKSLRLTAVGFHRLHLNPLAIGVAQKLDIFTYAYTVNIPQTAVLLSEYGLDGIVTDYPRKMHDQLPQSLR
jgi:glycerophosphoryl diester phosphodiesterase